MNDDLKVDFFVQKLILRFKLLSFSDKELIEQTNTYNQYEAFIDILCYSISEKDAFLVISPDILKKISEVIEAHRFEFRNNGLNDKINAIISWINLNKNNSNINARREVLFRAYQENSRHARFRDRFEMFISMNFDYVAYCILKNGDFDDLTKEWYSLFIMSLNYFMEEQPNIFNNPIVTHTASGAMDKIKKDSAPIGYFHYFLRKTKRKFSKIIKEE